MPKKRLDVLLVEKGFFETRARAQAALLAGKVEVQGCPRPKAGTQVETGAGIHVRPDAVPFVSRGGLKLEAALERFALKVQGRIAVDVGASTGGFTDCLLKRGAAKIYAVDVGRGQLDFRLRSDARVVCMERTHAGRLAPEMFDPRPDLAVMDVSFISITKVLPALIPCLRRPFELIALIKPQFELEPKKVPKGVVRRDEFRLEAVARVRNAAKAMQLTERGLMESPIKGPKGNRELLCYLTGGKAA
ncbi:MAG: TlyA family RNA methyltransferase [Elusimicrobia bacterium]|nr:TlyA family RNA methyltransferase [Elusimicrobiota bacterium]